MSILDEAKTVPVAGDGVALLYCAIILLVLTWVVFSLRVGVRLWRKVFGTDDYLMLVGQVLFSVTAALCIVSCNYGSGQHAIDLPPYTVAYGIKIFYIAEYFYAVSAAFIKISVAVTLLRIAEARRTFQWVLWGLIGLAIIAALVFVIGIANICRPTNALWGESVGVCDLQLNTDVSLFFSAIEIVTDFSLSILPAVLLWNIQMKRKVKISVAIMLGLASFASCATIVRLKYLTLYSDPNAFIYGTGKIGFWSLTEEGIGIIAGSLPALRPLLSLRLRIETSSNRHTPAESDNIYPLPSHDSKRTPKQPIMMDTLQTMNEHDDGDHSDGGSERHIVKETEYTVTKTGIRGREDELEREQIVGWERKTPALREERKH